MEFQKGAPTGPLSRWQLISLVCDVSRLEEAHVQSVGVGFPGGPSYVIELRAVVRHGPVQTELGRKFGKDISDVLPGRVVIRDPDSLFQFEFAARHIDVVHDTLSALRLLCPETAHMLSNCFLTLARDSRRFLKLATGQSFAIGWFARRYQ